jgi:hypothetical protein
MSTTEVRGSDATSGGSGGTTGMKIEVVVVPVSDVERSKQFYERLG